MPVEQHSPAASMPESPPALNFDGFRIAVSDSFVPLDVTSDHADQFRGSIHTADLGELHISEVSATPHVVERTPELIARGDRQYFKLSLLISGTGLLIQDNREALLRPGDLAIYDTERPYSLVFDENFRTMVVMFPKTLIDLPPDTVNQLTAVRMPGTGGIGSVLAPFLTGLSNNVDQFGDATKVRLAHSTLDLVTTMMASELDLEHANTDPHQVLMQRICDYIDANLPSTDLSPARIAAAHFISTRHLHGIFQKNGSTVSSWIRSRRLERCRRDLHNPLYAGRPVAAIAGRWGFVDAAHFSRVFKAKFGQAPSEYRHRPAP